MADRTGKPNLTAEQKTRIIELHSQFWTQRRIAAELGISQGTVSQTISDYTAIAGTKEALAQQAARMQATHILKLEYMAVEAMQAWERSKEAKRRLTKKTATKSLPAKGRKPAAEETTEETSATQEDQIGNPAYLVAAMKALSDARAIVGADAPAKVMGGLFGGGPMPSGEIAKQIRANPQANELVHELLLALDEAQ